MSKCQYLTSTLKKSNEWYESPIILNLEGATSSFHEWMSLGELTQGTKTVKFVQFSTKLTIVQNIKIKLLLNSFFHENSEFSATV